LVSKRTHVIDGGKESGFKNKIIDISRLKCQNNSTIKRQNDINFFFGLPHAQDISSTLCACVRAY